MSDNVSLFPLSTPYPVTRLYEKGPFAHGYVGTLTSEGVEPTEVLMMVPPQGASPWQLQEFKAQGERLVRLQELLVQREETGIVPAWVEQHPGPPPCLVTTLPRGKILMDRVLSEGALPEEEALDLVRRTALLLDLLHNFLNLVASSQAFAQARWHSEPRTLWLPVWQGALPSNTPALQAQDLERAGELFYLALSGRPLIDAWGRPILPQPHDPLWNSISSGARRLLCSLLHPHPDLRLRSTSEVQRHAVRLMRAWRDRPERLLDEADDLLAAALDGAHEKAIEAGELLDILRRREQAGYNPRGRWVLRLDELWDTCKPLLDHTAAVDRALQLTQADSLPAALDTLRLADNGARNSLALQRWQALLNDPAVAELLRQGNADILRRAVKALEDEDVEGADSIVRAWPAPPPSLIAEVEIRQAYRVALSAQTERETALTALRKAEEVLKQLPSPFARTLERELGALSHWRETIVGCQISEERQLRLARVLNDFESAQKDGRWPEAVSLLQIALWTHADVPELWEHTYQLALHCLQAAQAARAADLFALCLTGYHPPKEVRAGWLIARALSALEADPISSEAVTAAQAAVETLLAIKEQEDTEWPPLSLLQQPLEHGLRLAVNRTAKIATSLAGWTVHILSGELTRLARQSATPTDEKTGLVELQNALYTAVAHDREATIALVNRWLSELGTTSPAEILPQPSPLKAEQEQITARQVLSTATNWLFRSIGARLNAMLTLEAAGAPAVDQQIKRILQDLLAAGFDTRAAALEQYYRSSLPLEMSEQVTPLVAECERSLALHQEQMAQVVIALVSGQPQQALEALRKATDQGRSQVCWDWDSQDWVSVIIWQQRIQNGYVPDVTTIRRHLESPELQRWDYVSRLPLKRQLPSDLQDLVRKRLIIVEKHRAFMTDIFKLKAVSPQDALTEFVEHVQANRMTACWHPVEKRWYSVRAVQAALEQAARATPLMKGDQTSSKNLETDVHTLPRQDVASEAGENFDVARAIEKEMFGGTSTPPAETHNNDERKSQEPRLSPIIKQLQDLFTTSGPQAQKEEHT